MAKIQINNPRQTINGGAKKYYFKVKGLGGPKGDKGDKGDTGSRGPQGEPGNAATVYVGSTTTLPVGQDATVENVGTQYNAVLNFGIPQGPRGPQGIQGERGEPGQTGQTGPRGPQGERGTNATVYVGTTTTTNPGTQARVYNSGTDSNAVLNFEIPRGDVGPQPELVQTTGTSTTKAMSQNATTNALATKQNTIDSSHKLSADLVTDTSTTNKFVTAEDKTTWNAKQNALTAGQGIDITSDVISTPALVPEVVASLPAEGAESKLYLTPKAHTAQTATGNPITATLSEDAGAIESFQLDGDTLQNGTPTPSLPVAIQTVTGEQTVEIVGKNLFDKANANIINNTYLGSTALGTTSGAKTLYIPCDANTTYTISKISSARFVVGTTATTPASGVSFDGRISDYTTTQITITTNSTAKYLVVFYYLSTADTIDEQSIINSFQIEFGSSASSYAPYSKQTLPLNLGTIELCKLGTYQDYIYKSGDDWKVHKATAIASASNREWEWANISPNGWYFSHTNYGYYDTNKINVISKSFIGVKRSVAPNTSGAFITMAGDGSIGIRNPNMTGSSNATQFTNWLNSLNTTWLYARTTPIDTTITDTALIAQLEAIRTASLQNGANTITNTATGSNLAGDMEIGYYGYNPRNRYDKWLWLDINNEYEQIGS